MIRSESRTRIVPQIIGNPTSDGMTQGTLFTCAIASEYASCLVHGIVLTARCDIANSKVRNYNYVPVVKLQDWLERDGRQTICERIAAESFGSMKNALNDAGFSPLVMDTQDPHAILEKVFDTEEREKRVLSAKARFAENLQKFDSVNKIQSSPSAQKLCAELQRLSPSIFSRVLNELIAHRMAGYYYLDRVTPDDTNRGYVALHREVRTLPAELANAVSEGLDHRDYMAFIEKYGPSENLFVAPDDYSLPIGVLKSPNVEHFMQTFANLFTRIGIADFPDDYSSALSNQVLEELRSI